MVYNTQNLELDSTDIFIWLANAFKNEPIASINENSNKQT